MEKIREQDYLFATARVRGREKDMLGRERAERMIEAKTPADALKVLYEMGYGNSEEQVAPWQFEHLLEEEQQKTYSFVMEVAPNQDLFKLFQYPADYHNLKVLLKAEFQNTDPTPLLMDSGSIEAQKMASAVRERNSMELTPDMAQGMADVLDAFARTGDPQQVDLILDRACYHDMAAAAKSTGNAYLQGYVRLLIDIINLKTFARMRRMGKGWDDFSRVFLPGGDISEKLFIASYEEDLLQFADRLLAYGLQDATSQGAQELKEKGRFTTLEKLCDNRLMGYIRNSKYVAFGLEPLVGYLLAKESEIKTVRIIMAGKLAALPPEQIRERLRETYV
ncbi:MAG: V-type ATP synthase subunit C [Eubacteriales bacterium]